MKRISLLLVLALLVTTIGVGIVSANQPVEQKSAAARQDVKRLVIGTTDDISSLDPAEAYSFHDWEILRNVSEGLLAYIPGSTECEPRLALDFPVRSEDGLTYTFTLRDDAMFPDGTVLTPEIYAEWATRSLTLQGSPYGLISTIEKVEAGENNTIVFTLKEVFDLLPVVLCSQPQLYPYQAGDLPMDAFNNTPPALHGVGAYQLVSYTIGENATFQVNPNYYGEAPAFEEVVFTYYEDDAQLTLAIENGDIDMAWRSPTPTEIPRLADTEELEVITVPGRINYLSFNVQLEPVNNPLVRSAFAKAIDRDEIIDRAVGGLATPIYSMVPPGFVGATESYLDLYDVRDLEGAIADLTEAGYTADNKLEIELWFPPERYGGWSTDAMSIVEQQIEETGLVEITLQSQEWTSYRPAATSGEYPFFFLGWFFDYPDADNYLHPFVSCAGSPGLGINYCDEEMERLIAESRATVGTDGREEALANLQDYYAEQAPTIPLLVGQDYMIWNVTRVTNVIVGAPLNLEYRLLQPVE
ncbi:MAG: peptide ABC transporter substrate-binding protein [Chloroflexota bacterium]|nr:hypothetical protein [Chloroflexota bacterium]NOG65045.1 hypothetical protein [Chloroflexota bacterium]GIK65235.1 MAG: peptide ABC transporter substrate-binding protein [Chloroflexota bacterium]